jgi:hypothetical protein
MAYIMPIHMVSVHVKIPLIHEYIYLYLIPKFLIETSNFFSNKNLDL